MGFRSFKKELEIKKQQAQTVKELENAAETLRKKRDQYANEAKIAYRAGDKLQYKAKLSLLKNAMFNLSQTQEMLTNFIIAKDIYEMQSLNKKFVKSFDNVMKKVNATCKSINVGASQKLFNKALFNSGSVSQELKMMLSENGVAFSSVVDSVSDISDDDIKDLLGDEISKDEIQFDESLKGLEEELFNTQQNTPSEEKIKAKIGGANERVQKKNVVTEEINSNIEKNHDECVDDEAKSDNEKDNAEDKTDKGSNKENKQNSKEETDNKEYEFQWDEIPTLSFKDIAGLDDIKDIITSRVIIPLKNPELLKGYETKGGGGLCLYGPPGTGKSMFAAALAHEINGKFCEIKPSDILRGGNGNSEKAIKKLFEEARSFPCSVIFFDEMDSIAPKRTLSTAARQLRSEFLAQLQGVDSYTKNDGNILFVVCATNKPWDIDSAFLRPGRFGIRVYVGLPDKEARKYMLEKTFNKIKSNGVVELIDIDIDEIVERTEGYNGSDISNLIVRVQDKSYIRAYKTQHKYISMEDILEVLETVHSSVQSEDIEKLLAWKCDNDFGK